MTLKEKLEALNDVLNLTLTSQEERDLQKDTSTTRDAIVTGDQFSILQELASSYQEITFKKTNGSTTMLRVSDIFFASQVPNKIRINYVLLYPLPLEFR